MSLYNHRMFLSADFFCTSLKRQKLPDDVITKIFGWSSAEMIKIYSDIPEEERLEVVCDINIVKKVLKQLRNVHPYEEAAIDIIPLIDEENFS